jgi:hypothetical protein
MALRIKAADEVRTNSAGATVDDTLFVNGLEAGKLYEVTAFFVWVVTANPPSIRWAYAFTGTLAWALGVSTGNDRPVVSSSMTSAGNLLATRAINAYMLTTPSVFDGTMTGGTTSGYRGGQYFNTLMKVKTGGNFEFRWGQISASATPTTVFANSWLRVIERPAPG